MNFEVNNALEDESRFYLRKDTDKNRYMVARDGDWVLTPFQCERCWFLNVHGRLPNSLSLSDSNCLGLLRRANLDMFWSRETLTVSGVVGSLKEIIRRAHASDRPVPLDEFSPWPVHDSEGMGLALVMLEKS